MYPHTTLLISLPKYITSSLLIKCIASVVADSLTEHLIGTIFYCLLCTSSERQALEPLANLVHLLYKKV